MSTNRPLYPISYAVIPSEISRIINKLRVEGYTDEEIGIRMELPPEQVSQFPPPRPKPERSRAVQHQQLTKMAQALMPRVEKGEKDAISLMLKVMGREAALLGLDAPKEVVSHNFNKDMRDPNDLKTYTTLELQQMYQEALAKERPAIEGESSRA